MMSYTERAKLSLNPTGKRLFALMDEKQTNLGVAADVTEGATLLKLAEELGPEICLLKTHIDIIEDFTPSLVHSLKEIAEKHHFLLFEDRKFADIGNTVALQYSKGIYHIADWADIINAHTVPGPGIIEGLKLIGLPKKRALLLLAEMSSTGSLATGKYTKQTVIFATQHPEFVIGFIAQHRLIDDPSFVHMTPGVSLDSKQDKLGQNYLSPEKVLLQNKSDLILVGRSIIHAQDPLKEARAYRKAGWQGYQKRLSL